MADKVRKPKWFKGSETEWNRKSSSEQWKLIDEASDNAIKSTSNSMSKGFDEAAGALQRLLVHQSESYNIAKDWGTLMTNGNERMNIAIQFTADALKDEAKIRETITIEMGIAGALQEQQEEDIIDSAAATARYGITLDTVLQTMKAMSETLERNVILDDEQITNMNLLAKATGLGSYETAKLVEGFDTIGVGISGAIEQGEEMANVARKMGLNVNTFMSTMADNIK
ncbi:MAG TPA: hypothetical protein DEG69_18010, partial [Flavobacteriaceae bacterium]|nr:hypothetical protein [Flavobacteriaceae bacterium]